MGDAANGSLDVLAVHHLGHRLDADGTLPISLLPGLTGPCFKGETDLSRPIASPRNWDSPGVTMLALLLPTIMWSVPGSLRQCGEHSIDKCAGSLGGIGLGQPHRLGHNHCSRCLRCMTQFKQAETRYRAIDDRHPGHAPVLGSRFDLVVQTLFVPEDATNEGRRPYR